MLTTFLKHTCTHGLMASVILVFSLILTACGGSSSGSSSGGGGTPPPTITSFELLDPTPGAGDKFGEIVVILANGNIVVTDPNDSSVVANNGAVHLYNPLTQALIASIYGDVVNDFLGSTGITALANNNFVIASANDDEGGVVDAGSVRLVDGATGVQIGTTLAGDFAEDYLGRASITALANNNFVISSWLDDEGGIVNAGSVQLVNGVTGVQIGATLAGDFAEDTLGSNGIIALANNNFVITSDNDDEGIIVNAGSVRLVDGATGVQIGATIAGSAADDVSGATVTESATGDFYILSLSAADNNAMVDSGLVRLIVQ